MFGRVGHLFRSSRCEVWKLESIPGEEFDTHLLFIKKLEGLAFSILYDFRRMRLLLITVDFPEGLVESIAASVAGLEFRKLGGRSLSASLGTPSATMGSHSSRQQQCMNHSQRTGRT